MSDPTDLSVGVTATFACSYLDKQDEQLIMLIDPELNAQDNYLSLISIGFRRSGDQVYRPHCPDCDACQSLRLKCNSFILSKSQKRLLNKNKHFTVIKSSTQKPQYFALYERYINEIHKDGVMYPASLEQFESFMACTWGDVIFIEIYDGEN